MRRRAAARRIAAPAPPRRRHLAGARRPDLRAPLPRHRLRAARQTVSARGPPPMTPRVSVVMSVYNGAAHLRPTLDSIASQTLRDVEIIVVDDGSTDATGDILREAAGRDARIRIITQENRGLTRALIRGCATATAP